MTDIQTLIAELNARRQQQAPKSPIQALLDQARGKDAGAAKDGKAADPRPSSDRTVKDTVTLSDGGQKIVNLARGNELAAEFRGKPVDEGFFAALARARDDVLRIGRLFTETIKAAFQQSRK